MNLWNIIPESLFKTLLQFEGILFLPYVAILFYGYVFYALIKHAEQRIRLVIFLLLTAFASGVMFYSMGPGIGKIVPPLALLIVMLMPLLILIIQLIKKSYIGARIWALVTLAGWLHSISWSLWLFVLARS